LKERTKIGSTGRFSRGIMFEVLRRSMIKSAVEIENDERFLDFANLRSDFNLSKV
jgi:hypothetical protein